jgi:hypothetical protein
MQSPVEAANAIIDLYSLSLKRYSQGGTDYRSVVEFKHGFLWRFHHFIFDISKQVKDEAQTRCIS